MRASDDDSTSVLLLDGSPASASLPGDGGGSGSGGVSHALDGLSVTLDELLSADPEEHVVAHHWPLWSVAVLVIELLVCVVSIVYSGVAPLGLNPWLGPSADTLVLFGATWAPLIEVGQIWRVLTSLLIPVGLLQYAFLAVMRVFVSIPLERHVGSVRLGFVYVLSGIGGSLASASFLGDTIESGASPSVCGLLAVYMLDLWFYWRFHPRGRMEVFGVSLTYAIIILCGFLPGMDIFAHLGGTIMGIFAGLLVLETPPAFIRNRFHIPSTLRLRIAGSIGIALFLLTTLLLVYVGADAVAQSCEWCSLMNCIPLFRWCSFAPSSDSF
mmetsp:Transcript_5843/g.17892  ORF Transcript_5843/g.17892 Transcript_5843/m.17892 type:complete len:327 (+) Transcript_5843:135-1115(+)